MGEYSRPYTLKTQGSGVKEIPLLEVIKGINMDLVEQKKRYLPVFKNHLRKEKHFLSSYSAIMKTILTEDIKIHKPKMDLNVDQTCVEICMELQKFDELSFGNVMNNLKEEVDVWTSDKLSKIRKVVDRCYENENWEVDPQSKVNYSSSAVDLFRILYETFDTIYDTIGVKFFTRWSKAIKAMLDDVMFDYCSRLLDDIGYLYAFKKLFFLPNLNMKERKLSWPMQVSQRVKGKKIKVIFEEFEDEKFEINRICLRLGNLDYLRTHMKNLTIRFLTEATDTEKALQTLDDYINKVITVLCYKLTYCEFAQRIFDKLYFIDDSKKGSSDIV